MRILYLSANSGRRRVLEVSSLAELPDLMQCADEDIHVMPVDDNHIFLYCTKYPEVQNRAMHRLRWDLCFTGGDACIAHRYGGDVEYEYTPLGIIPDLASPYSFAERIMGIDWANFNSTLDSINGEAEKEIGSGGISGAFDQEEENQCQWTSAYNTE